MQVCKTHERGNVLHVAEEATRTARWFLANDRFSPTLIAEFITDISNPAQPNCCASAGYARYLMCNAFRHELREHP